MILLDNINLSHFQWAFPLALTIHNIEEAIFLPSWSKGSGKWHPSVENYQFRFAVLILTFLGFLVTYLSHRDGAHSMGACLLTSYALAMAINVIFPHLFASLAMRKYAPGLITGVFLNLPVCGIIVYLSLKSGYISLKQFLKT